MNFERFIAKKFLPRDSGSYSAPLTTIATCSIALGVAVMVVAVCILRGFQGEIREKVVGFGSHIVVRPYAIANTYEVTPVDFSRPEVERIRQTPSVRRIDPFAIQGGMIKTENQIHGILFKGVANGFDTTFFANCLVCGRMPDLGSDSPSNEVLVSQQIADQMHLSLGDRVRTYFWQGEIYRARAFEVSGIYNTDLSDFDGHYLVGDLRQVQQLNNWDSLQVGGYEVMTDNFQHLQRTANAVLEQLGYDLTLTTIVEQNPALFSWLDLLDSNIVLILIVMSVVCSVSVVSALLIMIFEKSSTIGILKALGEDNGGIRRIFLHKTLGIVANGIVAGEVAAWLLCWLQYRLHIVSLDSASYMMDYVPIDMNVWAFVAVGIGSAVLALLAMLVPTAYISHITPAKSIKFE